MKKSFTIKTIGCKVNTYESEKIRDELIKFGFNYIDVEEKEKYNELDFYIVNTCSVTKIADKKSRQMLHLAKKYNPKVKVIAIGCMVDSLSVRANKNAVESDAVGASDTVGANDNVGASYASPSSETSLAGVDYLLSNKEKNKLTDLLLSIVRVNETAGLNETVGVNETVGDSDTVGSSDIVGASYASPFRRGELCEPTSNINTRIRAFIKIQDGCNQYCTYCIIPFLRGNIKSRDDENIIEEIKEKVKIGVKEIVLTGIHLSSFGLDRVNKSYESEGAIDIARESLISIMNKVAKIDGVERIRLGSLEPRIINDYFLSSLVGANKIVGASYASPLQSKFCANFCLSLQSGSDKTLKRMNRHYTTSDFENACNLIRKYMPYATITTDIIVGFPGETEEDFEESLSFVKRMRFYNPNIFPYSRRQGTKADKMPDQLTNEVKHNRSVRTITECEKISKEIEKEYFEKYKDRANDILIEEYIERDGKKIGIGYTKEYVRREVGG